MDVLSGGRINPGVSVGPPMHYDDVREALYPDTSDKEDFSYERVARLLRFVDGPAAAALPFSFEADDYVQILTDVSMPNLATDPDDHGSRS